MKSEATQEEIIKALRAISEDPRKFDGDEVNVVGQATVTLCCEEHQCQISVNSEGTPLELLLGTDALGNLGFQVLHHNGNGKLHNLLSMIVMPEESATVVLAKEEAVTIKVLKATKVLGCNKGPGVPLPASEG